MKVLHLIHRDDPPPLLRVERLDAELLAVENDVEVWTLGTGTIRTNGQEIPEREMAEAVRKSGARVCHFYTLSLPPIAVLGDLRVPWIAPKSQSGGWWLLRREIEPDLQLSPLPALDAPLRLPEAVDSAYYEISGQPVDAVVGAIVSERTRTHYEAVRSRITRFRDDVRWQTFSDLPSPRDLSEVAAWVDLGGDPLTEESGVPEALVAGRAVIAPRTELNRERLLEGDAGFLIPQADPNELAHVLLTALFKPEVAAQRIANAFAGRDRFRPAHRIEELESRYRHLVDPGGSRAG